jgi:hypothetical protein
MSKAPVSFPAYSMTYANIKHPAFQPYVIGLQKPDVGPATNSSVAKQLPQIADTHVGLILTSERIARGSEPIQRALLWDSPVVEEPRISGRYEFALLIGIKVAR